MHIHSGEPRVGLLCRLVEEYPERAVSWFAVACYYLCTRQFEVARRYFGKATSMDSSFAPAWIGFGHSFAFQDESDQVGSILPAPPRLCQLHRL